MNSTNEILPQGYKITELGTLPEEWEVVRLGEVAEISSGGSAPQGDEYFKGDKPFIRVSHIDNEDYSIKRYDLIKDDTINGTTKIYLIKDFDKVLSLDLIKEKDSIDSELEKYIQDKIEERKIAKQNKDYALSDAIRDELLTKGIELIDTREGTTYKINK